MRSSIGSRRNSWQVRLTSGLVLASVAICSFGVPTSGDRIRRTGERFPCENCACGCPDAESCWRECCCYNTLQKLAWARRNGVTPPAFVVAAAQQAKRETHAVCLASCDACGRRQTPACCREKTNSCDRRRDQVACDRHSASPMSCHEHHSSAAASETLNNSKTPSSRGNFGSFFAALRCKGLSISVALLPPTLPPDVSHVALRPDDCSELAAGPNRNYAPPTFDVATPPPNAATA